ncbi:MAG: hypothetical protein JWR32_4704 [Mycobacterium sp.]|jgi:hypothetical protein|nr:hypothetical protein [Mycobacterium sp.]
MGSADKAGNKTDKLAGKAKDTIGRFTGNQRMEDEGRADRAEPSEGGGGEHQGRLPPLMGPGRST